MATAVDSPPPTATALPPSPTPVLPTATPYSFLDALDDAMDEIQDELGDLDDYFDIYDTNGIEEELRAEHGTAWDTFSAATRAELIIDRQNERMEDYMASECEETLREWVEINADPDSVSAQKLADTYSQAELCMLTGW